MDRLSWNPSSPPGLRRSSPKCSIRRVSEGLQRRKPQYLLTSGLAGGEVTPRQQVWPLAPCGQQGLVQSRSRTAFRDLSWVLLAQTRLGVRGAMERGRSRPRTTRPGGTLDAYERKGCGSNGSDRILPALKGEQPEWGCLTAGKERVLSIPQAAHCTGPPTHAQLRCPQGGPQPFLPHWLLPCPWASPPPPTLIHVTEMYGAPALCQMPAD